MPDATSTLALLAAAILAQSPRCQDPAAEPTPTGRKLAEVPAELALETDPMQGPDGKPYIDRARFAFGAGGQFVAYYAFRGNRRVAVAGDEILGDFDYLHPPVVDPLREHYAFRAGQRVKSDREQWWILVDGKRSKPFDWIGEVALGAGGEPAFWEQPGAVIQRDGAYNNGAMVFHFGRVKGKSFEGARALIAPTLSADGKTAVTAAQRGREYVALVATSRKQTPLKHGYPMLEDACISPNGKRVAVVATPPPTFTPGAPPPTGLGPTTVLIDGEPLGADVDSAGVPVFSPDSKKVAVKFTKAGRMGVALQGEKAPPAPYEYVGTPVFDDKGRELAFVSCAGGAIDEFSRLRVWGDDAIQGGRYALHRRSLNGEPETVVDDADGLAHPRFGPRGLLCYARLVEGKWHVIAGDWTSPPYDEVWPAEFAANGKSIGFGARIGRELWWIEQSLDK